MSESKSRIEAQDCIVLFADLQSGIQELTRTTPLERLRSGVRGLAELAKLFDIPVIVTGIRGEDGSDAKIMEEITIVLGDLPVSHRTICDCFQDEEIRSAIQATGKKTLLIAGVATELAVQLPALSASDEGYRAYIVVDACGGMSDRTEQAAFQRTAKAGASTVSVMTLAGELAGDFRRPEAEKAIKILYEMAGS